MNSSLPSNGVDGAPTRFSKLVRVPSLAQMTFRVRSSAIGLSFLDSPPSIAIRHGVCMTKDIAELDPRKEFDMLVANFSRTRRALPKHTVIGYAKRSLLALITSSRATREQYARNLHIQSSTVPDTPHTLPASSTKPQNIGTTSSASPPAWQAQVDLTHVHDESVLTEILPML